MRLHVGSGLSVCLLLLGCSSEPRTPTQPPLATSSAEAVATQPDAPLLLLPAGNGALAPWLEATVAKPASLRTLLVDRTLVSYGEHAAIFAIKAGQFFATDEASGVVGPLMLPDDARFVLLDGRDRVLAATSAGRLYIAANVKAAAVAGGFVETGSVPGAVDWAAGGDLIAAAKGPNVIVSKDGGKTWTTTLPAKSGTRVDVTAVFVRGDGVLAAQDADNTIVTSRDSGKTWHPFSVRAPLQQEGAMIFVGLRDCPVVLSRDGVNFADAELDKAFAGRGAWSTLLDTNAEGVAHPARPMISASEPKPPASPKVPFRGASVGNCSGSSSGRPPQLSLPTRLVCSDPFCYVPKRGASPLGRTRFELFEDGQCAASDADPASGDCKPAAKLTRQPTLAVGDAADKNVRALPLPEGCRFGQLFASAGAALLLCAEGAKAAGQTRLFMIDARGVAHAEGTLPASADAFSGISLAADGTLLLHCGSPGCTNHVRAPRALGEASAWRTVELPNQRVLRPWLGGAVVALTAETDAAFAVVLAAPNVEPKVLAHDVVMAGIGRVTDVSLEGAHVTLVTSDDAAERRLVVSQQGTLAAP